MASRRPAYTPLKDFKGTYEWSLVFVDKHGEEESIVVKIQHLPLGHVARLGWSNRLIAAFVRGVIKVSLYRPGAKKSFWHTYLPSMFFQSLMQTCKGLTFDGLRMNDHL